MTPRPGVTTGAGRLVQAGAEDGVVLRIVHGATRHLRGQPTQVTLLG